MIKILILAFFLSMPFTSTLAAAEIERPSSAKLQQVYELQYVEREPGVDDYNVTMLVSDRYIRLDEQGESSGFIIYDDETKTIFSVSHHDKSILVINEFAFSETDMPVEVEVEYLQLADAPKVSGKYIYNYRVFTKEKNVEETCMEIQLVENLLPDVAQIMKNYQMVISGQQVKMTDNKLTEMQTACFFADQIYNMGLYYDKGFPIQEWHSNERSRILSSYKKADVSLDTFMIPDDYNQFSIDNNSKTFIK
jgi:hypothetical protein